VFLRSKAAWRVAARERENSPKLQGSLYVRIIPRATAPLLSRSSASGASQSLTSSLRPCNSSSPACAFSQSLYIIIVRIFAHLLRLRYASRVLSIYSAFPFAVIAIIGCVWIACTFRNPRKMSCAVYGICSLIAAMGAFGAIALIVEGWNPKRIATNFFSVFFTSALFCLRVTGIVLSLLAFFAVR